MPLPVSSSVRMGTKHDAQHNVHFLIIAKNDFHGCFIFTQPAYLYKLKSQAQITSSNQGSHLEAGLVYTPTPKTMS